MPDVRILNFPDSRQATSFSCGAAATQAVLYYYGIERREDELIKALKSNPEEGTEIGQIIRYLEEHDLKTVAREGMSIQDLRSNVEQGWPTILAIQAWADETVSYDHDFEDGHYVTAIGYTAEGVVFDDPSIITNRGHLSNAELTARWHDKDQGGRPVIHFGITVIGTPRFRAERMLKIEMLKTAREHPALGRYLVPLADALGR